MLKVFNIFKDTILNHILIRGSQRTQTVKKNAYLSFLVVLANNIVGMLFIPVVIGMIEPIRYGIWLTVQSTLNWFNLMDLGLGGGLRTRLAQALAVDDRDLARRYISTGYAFLITMMASVALVFVLVQRHINWVKVFNAPTEFASELSLMMFFVVLLFLAKFIMALINNILTAFQMTFISSLVSFIGHLSSLLVIFFLFMKITPTLFLIGLIYSLSPVLVLIATSIILFSQPRFRDYRPSLRFIHRSALKPIMTLGVFEFIDRVSFIVILSATNLIISHLGSPKDVVPYNVTMRFLGIFVTINTNMTMPMTPAFTEAYTKNDQPWIKRVLRKTNLVGISLVAIMILSIPILKPIIDFMLRGKVSVPLSIIILASILVSQRMLSGVFGRFITGIGKIRLVVLTTAISATFYLPFVWVLSKKLMFGVLSVIIAQICVEFPIALVKYLQTRKVLAHTATGLWNK